MTPPSGAEMAIDWTAPLELVDGTPVRLRKMGGISNPDRDGDYWLVREDGASFTDEQTGGWGEPEFVANPDGRHWLADGEGAPLIRNRAANAPAGVKNDLVEALAGLVTAVCFADPPKEFNGVLCHEARIPVEFVQIARAALAKAEVGAKDYLVEALEAWRDYDLLLRRYSGPRSELLAGDEVAIDQAYDRCVRLTEAAIARATGAA